MPIRDTRNIVPFVNDMESKVVNLQQDLQSWLEQKGQVIQSIPLIDRNRVSSLTAIIKAEDALAEINTAVFGVTAAKGQKLKKLLDDIKNKAIEAAANAGGKMDPRFQQEIDNAVSSVDPVIADGLKLDYRLRKIQSLASQGADASEKIFIMPHKYESGTDLMVTELTIAAEQGAKFVAGEVTVLNADGSKAILDANKKLITGTIDINGHVILSSAPNQPVKLFYPVRIAYADLPEDVLYFILQTVLEKNNPIMEKVLLFEQNINQLLLDVAAMKGEEWTVDFSIMRNQKEIVKESITPKGLMVHVESGMVNATFSYNDHPELDHFILEKRNEATGAWEPFNGTDGIVAK